MTDDRPDPVWCSAAPPASVLTPLDVSFDVDVAVIGAGFLGLVAAIELAQAGKSVALLEAKDPATNASGASAGQIGPMFLGGGRAPHDVLRVLGEERGGALARLVADSGRWLFDFLEKNKIQCEARQGYLCAYRTEKTLSRAAERFSEWAAYGGKFEPVAGDKLHHHISTTRFAGGYFLPEGGLLNPAQLLTGLISAAQAAGVRVHCRSRVISLDCQGSYWEARTSGSCVKAQAVIVATGVDAASPLPILRSSVYAAGCGVAATAPLGNQEALVLPRRGPVADLDDKAVFAPALTADNRLVASFLLEREPPRLPGSAAPARKRLQRVFPECPLPSFETLSWGRIAITPDGLPRLFRNSDGIIAVGGCNGFGLTLGLIAARQAVRLVLGTPTEQLALPITEPRRLRGAAIAPALFRTVAAPLANRFGG